MWLFLKEFYFFLTVTLIIVYFEQRLNINNKCWLQRTNARGGNTSYICPTFGDSERITLLQGLISTKCSKGSEKKNNILIKHNLCGDTVKGQYCFLGDILCCDKGFSGPKDKPYLRPPTPGTFALCVTSLGQLWNSHTFTFVPEEHVVRLSGQEDGFEIMV